MKTKWIVGLGFLAGGITTFYALPYLEREFGVIPRPGYEQLAAIEIPILMDPSAIKNKSQQSLITTIYLSIDLANAAGLDKPASKHTLSVIAEIAEDNQDMRQLIMKALSNKDVLSNNEALIIFDHYLNREKRD